jgi:hypothetical protein
MRRQIKCKLASCGQKGDADEMIVRITHSETREYKKHYHPDCYEKQLEMDKENADRDKLNDIIKSVHKIPEAQPIPQQFWLKIQELRHGMVIFGKKKKRYKQGFDFDLISETYEHCRESIEYWKKNKEFASLLNELQYGFAIINDKINIVKKKRDKKEHQNKVKEAKKDNIEQNIISEEIEVKFKKDKSKKDISKFLD